MPRNGNIKPESKIDGKKDEESHLHRLQLIFCNGGKRDAHRQVGDNEDERDDEQQKNTSLHRHMKEKVGGDQNDRDLDVTDENVGHDFSDEHFARAGRHREKIFHRARVHVRA